MENDFINIDESAIPLDKVMSKTPGAKEGSVTELHLLGFGKSILSIVALIYVLAGIGEIISPGNAFYKAVEITLPSIATLVIGYYFGSSKS